MNTSINDTKNSVSKEKGSITHNHIPSKNEENFYRFFNINVKGSKLFDRNIGSFPPAAPVRITPYSQSAEEFNHQLSSSF